MTKMNYDNPKFKSKKRAKIIKDVKGFAAKFPGVCIKCDEPIEVDQMIGWFAPGKVYHISHLND